MPMTGGNPSDCRRKLRLSNDIRNAGLVFSDFSVVDFSGDVRTERAGIRWKYGVVRHAAATPWDSVFGESDVVRWAGGEAIAHFSHLAHWLFMGNLINTCSVLLRREVVERIGLFYVSLSTEEDYDYWLRVAEDWPMVNVDAPPGGVPASSRSADER